MRVNALVTAGFFVMLILNACSGGDSGSSSGGSTGSSGTAGASGSTTDKGALKTEGQRCDCGDETMCRSTEGPCEASLTCVVATCVDTSKTCEKRDDCPDGYACRGYVSNNIELGQWCTKR